MSIELNLSVIKFLLADDLIRGGVVGTDIGLNCKMREPLGKAHLVYSDTKKMFCMVRAWNCENMVTGKNMSHEAVLKIVVKDIIVSDSIRFLGRLVVVRANYLLEYT